MKRINKKTSNNKGLNRFMRYKRSILIIVLIIICIVAEIFLFLTPFVQKKLFGYQAINISRGEIYLKNKHIVIWIGRDGITECEEVTNPLQTTIDLLKSNLFDRESIIERQITLLADYKKQIQTLSETYVSDEILKAHKIDLLKLKTAYLNSSLINLQQDISDLQTDISRFSALLARPYTGDCHYLIQFPKLKLQ